MTEADFKHAAMARLVLPPSLRHMGHHGRAQAAKLIANIMWQNLELTEAVHREAFAMFVLHQPLDNFGVTVDENDISRQVHNMLIEAASRFRKNVPA